MAAPDAKPRRRIVPQMLASPSSERPIEFGEPGGAGSAATAPPEVQQDQQAQAEWAREHLGPDRKVFLDLTTADNKEVDWRKILKERGVRKPGKAATKQAGDGDGDDPLLLRGRAGRQDNSWTRMLAKLEATYCVGGMSDGDEDDEEDEYDDDSGSDAEEEGAGGEEGGKGGSDGGGRGGGERGGEGDGNTTGGEGCEGGAAGGGVGKKGKSQALTSGYDYFDEWIDDAEFVELLEHDKRKPKHLGFFISKGEIERTEEMLPGFEDLAGGKKSGKRKADDEGAAAAPSQAGAAATAAAPAGAAAAEGAVAAAAAPAGEKKKRKQQEAADGGGGAAAGEGDKPPAKKKKKIVPEAVSGAASGQAPAVAAAAAPAPAAGLSIAQLAVMAARGVLPGVNVPAASPAPAAASTAAAPVAASLAAQPQPSGSQAPPASAKKKVPYELPAEVAAAIESIRAVAAQEPAPPPVPAAAEEGGKRQRRVLPRAIKDALAAFSPLYLQQTEAHGQAAINRILDGLDFLLPFVARANLSSHLRGASKKKPKDGAAGAAAASKPFLSADSLRQLISSKVAAVPVGSDDDFEAPAAPRNNSASPPATQGPAGAGGGGGAGGEGPQAPASAATAAAAAAAAMAASQKWKSIDSGVRQQVYQYFKERLAGQTFQSSLGKTLQDEVYNLFPPNSIDMAALKSIYMAGKAREKRLEATAAATAAAAAAPVAAVAAARLAGVAPAPAATAAVASASLPSAQPAPAVEQPATQQQELKEEEQQAQAQPPAKDARPPPVSAEAFAAMAIAQAQAKLTPPAKQQPAQQAASAAAAPTPAPVPAPAAGDAQEQRLDAAGALDVLAAAASSPAAALDPAARQAAAAGPPAVPAVSDEECIAKGVSFGGDEEALLAVLNSSKSGVYNTVYAKVLMMSGPEGETTAGVARRAVQYGWSTWDPTNPNIKNSLARATQKDYIVHIGKSKFALRAFPGVVEVPRPQRAKAAGSSAGASPAEGGMVVAAAEAQPGPTTHS